MMSADSAIDDLVRDCHMFVQSVYTRGNGSGYIPEEIPKDDVRRFLAEREVEIKTAYFALVFRLGMLDRAKELYAERFKI